MNEKTFIERFLKDNTNYVVQKYGEKQNLTVTSKDSPTNLLTDVDLTIQKRFIEALQQSYPDDQLVAEESGHDSFPKDPDGRVWVIDPIDGTFNFVRGLTPAFAISIAFMDKGLARVAGVSMPLNGYYFFAESGQGAWCNERRLAVSSVQQLDHASLEIDFSSAKNRRSILRRGRKIMREVAKLRSHGSAVVAICQVATGDSDAYIHPGLHPWDFAAAQLIAEEAGALATRLNGEPLRVFDKKKGVLISNGALHQTLLDTLIP
ncbi:MAG: inositol monophosphatase [Candidatus Hydrogenedens sp.]|jgi:myo-inositol-1(or 4)-monophosphatase|nr:inositol monophosphatase [Candidatus Hydrogenedens sp.]